MQQKDKKTIRASEPEQERKPLSSEEEISQFPETEGEGLYSTAQPSDDSAPSASSSESKGDPDENGRKNAPIVNGESEAVAEGTGEARKEETSPDTVFPDSDAMPKQKVGEELGPLGAGEKDSVEKDRQHVDDTAGSEESLTDWGQSDPFAPPEEFRKDEEEAIQSQSSPSAGASDEGRPYRKPPGVLKWTKKESDAAGKQSETELATTPAAKKRRFRLNRKQGLMFVFVWLPLLSVAALAGGLMIGYSVLGNDPVGEVFTRELWEHLYNLIYG